MDEALAQQLTASAQQLAAAADALEQAIGRLDAQHEALTHKVDLIIASIDEHATSSTGAPESAELKARVADLERANAELKAQAARASRKTLPPLVTALLAKNSADDALDSAALERALAPLSVEQRVAVKAEMARAGMID